MMIQPEQDRSYLPINSYGVVGDCHSACQYDGSYLLLPLVGFLPANDPRMRSTVDRIHEYLTDEHGFIYRYRTEDGQEEAEGPSLLCTFWLVDNLALQGRYFKL
jgi:GH15 family glucan-1,4-alpha-glucosidase